MRKISNQSFRRSFINYYPNQNDTEEDAPLNSHLKLKGHFHQSLAVQRSKISSSVRARINMKRNLKLLSQDISVDKYSLENIRDLAKTQRNLTNRSKEYSVMQIYEITPRTHKLE